MAGESRFIQHREHELAGGIAGKRASSAVGAVRTGSQAHDKNSRAGIAEPRHRLAPVFTVAVSAALLVGNQFAIGDEAWAARAGNDFAVESR